jgi:hypothetical protein
VQKLFPGWTRCALLTLETPVLQAASMKEQVFGLRDEVKAANGRAAETEKKAAEKDVTIRQVCHYKPSVHSSISTPSEPTLTRKDKLLVESWITMSRPSVGNQHLNSSSGQVWSSRV